KAHVIETQGHYLEVSRYIHLNPVRARMVERAQDYPWSSYPGYHWSGRKLPWVTYEQVLGEFGGDNARARARYRQFVREGANDEAQSPLEEAYQGLVLEI
ncbi:MAG: hypothetical protein GY807_09820, partial [Gammaproteobacteria bacterium]|nr:hypothetical protein [Gammaproteobacteria bacterium]